MTINFYHQNGEYGCFSNFSNHTVKLKGKEWPTSEHYFQAQKFAGTKHESEVRKCKGPMAAANMGRDRSLPLRSDWENVKDNMMRVAVLAKFLQNDDCRKTLLSTGTETLVEHTEKDKYWADGGNGQGKNMLGVILMEVREVLAKREDQRERMNNSSSHIEEDDIAKEPNPIDVYVGTHNLEWLP
jgi:ribA/ribD-fused uncharacterized protein